MNSIQCIEYNRLDTMHIMQCIEYIALKQLSQLGAILGFLDCKCSPVIIARSFKRELSFPTRAALSLFNSCTTLCVFIQTTSSSPWSPQPAKVWLCQPHTSPRGCTSCVTDCQERCGGLLGGEGQRESSLAIKSQFL